MMYYTKNNTHMQNEPRNTEKNTHVYTTTIFKTNKKELIFVGCSHKYGGSKEVGKFLNDIFAKTRPEAILLESSYKKTDELKKRIGIRPRHMWGEQEQALFLSQRYKSLIFGMDESLEDTGKYMIKYIPEGLKASFFVMFLFQYISTKRVMEKLSVQDLYQLAKTDLIINAYSKGRYNYTFLDLSNYINKLQKYYGLNSKYDTIEKALNDIVAKDPSKKNILEILRGSIYTNSKYVRNKHSVAYYFTFFNAIRERRMYETCISSMKKYDRVVAIAGSSHISQLRTVLKAGLENEFGKTELFRWYELTRKNHKYIPKSNQTKILGTTKV